MGEEASAAAGHRRRGRYIEDVQRIKGQMKGREVEGGLVDMSPSHCML